MGNAALRLKIWLAVGVLLGVAGCKSAARPEGASGAPAPVVAQHVTPVDWSTASFDVDVTLSAAALTELKSIHERVSVLATLTGKPRAGAAKGVVDGEGNVFLGNDLEQEAPGKTIRFKRVALDKAALAATDGGSPQLKITAGSSILHTENNILTCTSYDGPLAAVQGKSVAISCKNLGE